MSLGLPTPVGSDEVFKPKLFRSYLHYVQMTFIGRNGKQGTVFGFLGSKRVGQHLLIRVSRPCLGLRDSARRSSLLLQIQGTINPSECVPPVFTHLSFQ
jgi:hypothetical protein